MPNLIGNWIYQHINVRDNVKSSNLVNIGSVISDPTKGCQSQSIIHPLIRLDNYVPEIVQLSPTQMLKVNKLTIGKTFTIDTADVKHIGNNQSIYY